MARRRSAAGPILLSGALAIVAGVAGALAAGGGGTLGVYFAGTGLLTLLLPGLVLAERTPRRQWLVTLAGVGGMGLVWLAADRGASLGQRLTCTIILGSYVAASCAAAQTLRRAGIAAAAAAAVGVVTGLLWLSWPVWLSPWLEGARGEAVVGWLVPAHPLFALNAVHADRGAWTHHAALMYNLTHLGQHLRYAMPAHPWWCVLGHTLLAAGASAAAQLPHRRTRPHPNTGDSGPGV
jgi:hypothetical protein